MWTVWHGEKHRSSRKHGALSGMAFECLLHLSSITRLYCYEVCHFISNALDTQKLCQTVIRTLTLLLSLFDYRVMPVVVLTYI